MGFNCKREVYSTNLASYNGAEKCPPSSGHISLLNRTKED